MNDREKNTEKVIMGTSTGLHFMDRLNAVRGTEVIRTSNPKTVKEAFDKSYKVSSDVILPLVNSEILEEPDGEVEEITYTIDDLRAITSNTDVKITTSGNTITIKSTSNLNKDGEGTFAVASIIFPTGVLADATITYDNTELDSNDKFTATKSGNTLLFTIPYRLLTKRAKKQTYVVSGDNIDTINISISI